VLTGSDWNGMEQLLVDGECVSQKRNLGFSSRHQFSLEGLDQAELSFTIDARRTCVSYQLHASGQLLFEDVAPLPSSFTGHQAQPIPGENVLVNGVPDEKSAPVKQKKSHLFVLFGVAFKLLKTAKVFKVALVAASVSVYSVMFTVEFAVALVAILVFHEYGHLRAMKRFGIPTKGMYLIPFVGCLAVGDKPKSRWQDVYISLMGPIYGLAMTLAFYIGYLITENHFVGLVASTSALINLFNLLPVYPLDGGRVIKSLVFSGRKYFALVFLLFISALCTLGAFKFGLALIGFFIILGVVDILAEWRISLAEDITPLTSYGIWFCLLWYLATLAAFLGIIVLIAQSELPGSEIALRVLNS
jgi:Zn-dependent protease